MKVLSLFDWISCARLALDRAGIAVESYFASEIDTYAIQVAQKNYPDTIQLGNVQKVRYQFQRGSKADTWYWLLWEPRPERYTQTMRKVGVDLLIWGSPCQDLSIAKKDRKGLDGEKSGLFREYVRILKEVKPKWFILENVASMSKESKQTISETLWVEPILIDAALVSAQSRKRLFRTNISWVVQPKDKGITLNDILENTGKPLSEREIAYMNRETSKGRTHRDFGYHQDSAREKSTCLTSNLHRWVPYNVIIQRPRGYNKGWEHYEKSPTLTSNSRQQNNKLSQGGIVRKLTPTECERLQSLPDNYTEGISNIQRYRCLGNAFNVEVVSHILSFIPKG